MLGFYNALLKFGEPLLRHHLNKRVQKGKEIAERLPERFGETLVTRPAGPLIWIHAASVGESQSALILIKRLLEQNSKLNILVTTGTVTSASLFETRNLERVIHQFVPLDHPRWVSRFINHWKPSLAIWVESELWPNLVISLKENNIPAALVNARMSDTSFKRWSWLKNPVSKMLGSFNVILCQTESDAEKYQALGADHCIVTDNLKYSARPLSYSNTALKTLNGHIMNRPLWLYASTHKGEEEIACRIHQRLKATIPDLLTVIVPRHPHRREEIKEACKSYDLDIVFRHSNSSRNTMPDHDTDIYVADTMGELGVFYRLAPVACIGRSLSDDGGGGHNPIEAAQLGCAVLYGPHVHYQKQIFDEMTDAQAARMVQNEDDLKDTLELLFFNVDHMENLQRQGYAFVRRKARVVETVMKQLQPLLDRIQ